MAARKSFLGVLIAASLFIYFSSGCAPASARGAALQKEYGADADYYLGLRSLANGNTEEAVKQFSRAAKKGSYYVALKSMEMLSNIGNIQTKIENCEALVKKYPTENSFTIAAREYIKNAEYSKLILMTDSVDVAECPNELSRLRITSLYKKQDSRFSDALYRWFTERALSNEHDIFFSEILEPQIKIDLDDDAEKKSNDIKSDAINSIIQFRTNIFRRNYLAAYEMHNDLMATFALSEFQIFPNIVSDIGRAFLFSGKGNSQNLKTLLSIATQAEKNSEHLISFYARFYLARLSEKIENYNTARNHYEKAMEAATALNAPDRYDNALWYLLNSILNNAPTEIVQAVKTYCTKWHDATYYDDFFNSLAVTLISSSRWSDFKEILSAVDGYASYYVSSHYSYVYARFSQMGIIKNATLSEQEIKQFFERAIESGSINYYSILSAIKLGFSNEELLELLTSPKAKKPNQIDAAKSTAKSEAKKIEIGDVEKFLRGYAIFGLPEYLYDEWIYFYNEGVKLSLPTNIEIASFLKQCGENDNKYFPQSLRIAYRVIRNCDEKIPVELLKLVYPNNFEKLVDDAYEQYGLPQEILFALIRSESFFEADVKSSAGAVGLTQLMDFTAADIAQRLKRIEYDITVPKDSIQFGAYYLNNLISRLDSSPLPALFAYNAGITRVRRWINATIAELRPHIKGNYDLFLETVPFEETRGYGRNVIEAAIIYGMLYYDKNASELADELLG